MLEQQLSRPATKTIGWVLSIALILPILSVLFTAASSTPPPELQAHFLSVLLPRYVLTTFALIFGVTFVAALFGVTCAWLVNIYDFPGRRLLTWGLLLPFAVPPYLSAYAYVDFFQVTGPVFSWLRANGWASEGLNSINVRNLGTATVVIAGGLFPYFFLACTAALRRESMTMLDAARTLGASAFTVFFRLGLPILRPAIAAGGLFVIFEVLNEFGAVDHFALDTFATGLYRAWYGYGDKTLASQLAGAFLVLAFVVILCDYLLRGRARYATSKTVRQLPRQKLSGVVAFAVSAFCTLPVVIGFVIPCSIFLFHYLQSTPAPYQTETLPLALRSLGLATITSSLAVLIGAMIAWAFRTIGSKRNGQLAKIFSTLGYSIPGSLVAIGVLQLLPVQLGYLSLLVVALLTRFSGIAVRNLEAGFEKITPSMEAAARTLGATPTKVLIKIFAPLLTPAGLAAWLLIFVDTIKELPASIILRPFDFQILPIFIYNLASDERLADASGAALLLVLVCLLPVGLLYRKLFFERIHS
jgi:iron(III) transport system permease protein